MRQLIKSIYASAFLSAHTTMEIDAVLQEFDQDQEDVGECLHAASSALPATSNVVKLTVNIVNQACGELQRDDCMPESVREICKNLDSSVMLPVLQFLNNCLVPRHKFTNTAKEHAYSKFHKMCTENMSTVAERSSELVAPWLCLKTFELLIKLQYEPEQVCSEISMPLLDTEHDIVEYIGGFVIQKRRKKARRLQDKDVGAGIIKCLEKLTCSDGDSTTKTGIDATAGTRKTLTSILDRGGLIKLKPNSVLIFLGLEMCFRELFGDASSVNASFKIYLERCSQSESVSTCLYDILCKTDVSDSTKEKILEDVVHLYFKVRMYHKCKTIMDSFRRRTKTTKKAKGIRKQLK